MSENCFHSNPLRRDGTNQKQRTLKELLPSYVAVDERSMKDLMTFVQAFGEEIRFFDRTNAIDGHWADFFKITDEEWETFSLEDYLTNLKIDQAANPHLALFFGFLYIFKVVQDDINTITERHLEYYYKEVLQIKERAAEPDKVAVIFELAKHVESHLLKMGTALKAGKDNTGANVIYKLNEDTVINIAQIGSLKAQFANLFDELPKGTKFPKTDHRVYISPQANSGDGLGSEIETEEKDWPIFGRPSFVTDEEAPSGLKIANRQEGKVGFAIASPLLFLSEGQRKISLEIGIEFGGDQTKVIDVKDKVSLLLSGEEEWIEANFLTGDIAEIAFIDGQWKLNISVHLKIDQPAVVAYNNEVLLENINTKWPVLKLLINTEDTSKNSFYKRLKGVQANTIELSVEIDGEGDGIPGMQDLLVQNDNGSLDASKPIPLFGNQPYLGSKFYIGHWEAFQKSLEFLTFKWQWVDLPTNSDGFLGYYNNYTPTDGRDNRDFWIRTEMLDKKEWQNIAPGTYYWLFRDIDSNPIDDSSPLPNATQQSKLHLDSSKLSDIDRNFDMEQFEEYDNNLQRGFVRFVLSNVDFGHKTYAKDFSDQAILLSKESPPADAALPNAPYEPAIENLSLYYKSALSFDLAASGSEGVEQFFHLEPFGNYEVDLSEPTNTLLPTIKQEGTLFIGIEDLQPPQTLAMLVQVAEGSANPVKEKQEVEWAFLSENTWTPFDQYSLLNDSTNGLLTSGIVKFDIPRTATKGNTRLDPNLHWIKASVRKDSDAVCDVIDIRTQAISASFVDDGNDPKFLEKALEPGTISKLLNADASIKKLEQPYASSDGKPPEKERAFYTRVSERLRHKNRAINIWDYEHLILEKFPKVYKVKCVNHTSFEGLVSNYSETAPGHVSVVIIANVQNKNAVDPLRPLASLDQLSEIKAYIEEIKPPCAVLHVKNPIYEEVKVDFKVKFHKGIDAGYYLTKLREEIKQFLSPWSTDCYSDIVFGGRIHKSVLLNFVEERSYVDYVTCFKMYHIVKEDPENNPNEDVDEAIALTSVSIIGSADDHIITEIAANEADQCQCEDNIIPKRETLLSVDNC